jgi:RimJ/RimL family protein N-acetyltransferase
MSEPFIFKPLSGKTLTIRPFLPEDFSGIRRWVNNREVTRDLVDSDIFEHEHSEAETRTFLEGSLTIDRNNIRLVTADKGTNSYLGQLALFNFTPFRNLCELDIVMADPDKWDQGQGSEAVNLITEWALGWNGLEAVIAQIKPQNCRARACAEKEGFRYRETLLDGTLVLIKAR